MKRTFARILPVLCAILLALPAMAQYDMPYIFITGKMNWATNIQASECIRSPHLCHSFGTFGELEYLDFFNHSIATRCRLTTGYAYNNGGFPQVNMQMGFGLVATVRDRSPYGFMELRPRLDIIGNGTGSTRMGSCVFMTLLMGLGYDIPLTSRLWLMAETGLGQDLALWSSDYSNRRNECPFFISAGTRYWVNGSKWRKFFY